MKLTKRSGKTEKVILSLSMLSSSALVGCQSRSYSGQSSTPSKGATAASFLPPVVSDPSLLTNLADPKDLKPFPVWQDLIVRIVNTKPEVAYSSMLDSNGVPLGTVSFTRDALIGVPQDVLAYEKLLLAAQLKDPKRGAPAKFAAASVLAVMRKNRLEFGEFGEGRTPNAPNLLGESSFLLALPSVTKANLQHIRDPSLPFSKTSCRGYDVRDYNDTKWHYYCAIPPIFRACQRSPAGGYFNKKSPEIVQALNDKKLTNEEYAIALAQLGKEDDDLVHEFCLNPDSTAHAYFDDLRDQVKKIETSWTLPPGTITRLFKKFHESQVDPVSKVNMYDYIMGSGIYAFDFTQQQAVLNAYYGEMKPLDGVGSNGTASLPGKAFDPDIESDCVEFREKRFNGDLTTGTKTTFCNPKTERSRPYFV